MISRDIKIVSTRSTQPVVISTDAANWGELKTLLQSEYPELLPSSYRAVLQATKQDLVSDEATLPEGDQTIWINPVKIKSGALDESEREEVRAIFRQESERVTRQIGGIVVALAGSLPTGEIGLGDAEPETENEEVNQARNFFGDNGAAVNQDDFSTQEEEEEFIDEDEFDNY